MVYKTASKESLFSLIILLVLFGQSILFAQNINIEINPAKQENFYKIQKAKRDFYESIPEHERKGFKQFRRWENFWEPRVFPTGEFPQAIDIHHDWMNYSKHSKKYFNSTLSNQWRLIGPITRPEGENEGVRDQGIGRVNVIRYPKDNPNEIWAGAATGGVWRSKDDGKTWENFPFTQFLSLGVSDIQISPSNPNVVYVATGDADGSSAAQNYYSVGIIKTTDGGTTWDVTEAVHALEDRKLFGKMFISPTDPNVVIATSNSGIIKTTDGGATWSNKLSGFFIDLESKPDDANVLYASNFSYVGVGEIHKSTDMGETWKKVNTVDDCIRIAIEVTPANPNKVYAVAVSRANNGFNSFWVSEDAGEFFDVTFTKTSGLNLLGWSSNGKDFNKGQGQYDLALAVSPINENIIYLGGVNIWRSTNGGFNWSIVAHWSGDGAPLVHADQHDLKFSIDGKKLYAAHDGGIDRTTTGGSTWSYLSDGMSITQFYRMGISQADPTAMIGGAQDNGTSIYINGKWTHVLAGDGMDCAIDPTDAKRIYGSLYYGDFRRSTNGGSSFQVMLNKYQTNEEGAWVAPIAIDPQATSTLYAGYYNVWRSMAYGNSGSWVKLSNFTSGMTLQQIEVSPIDKKTIYASDYRNLYASYDGGGTWTSILNSDMAISKIAPSYSDAKVVYITKSGFQGGNKVWRYDGEKWYNMSGNLPNVPANCIVMQKDSPDRLYVGTDVGVFYSDYGSNIWQQYGDNLPNIIVNDIDIQYPSKKLKIATWGRGMWETDILECNLPKPEISYQGKLQFCEGDSVKLIANVTSGDIVWTTGETSKEIFIKEDGSYSFMIKSGDGCNAKSDIITVSVAPVDELTVTTSKAPALCIGDSVALNARLGFKSYKWSNGETTRKITVKDAGTYYCTGTTSDGCEAVSDVIEVSFHPIPDKPSITQEVDLLVSTEANKYQWYINNKAIESATEQKYKPTAVGKYKVAVAESGDCWTFSDEFEVLVGVQDEFARTTNLIEINPNPSNGISNIYIPLKNNVRATITITDLSGREIYKFNELSLGNGINTKVDLTNQPAGTYIVIVRTDNNTISQKLIKM